MKQIPTHQMIHTVLNSLTQRQALLQSRNNHNYLPAVQHSAHTDSQSHPRHGVDVVVEKAGVGEDCIICQCFDRCAGGKRQALNMK